MSRPSLRGGLCYARSRPHRGRVGCRSLPQRGAEIVARPSGLTSIFHTATYGVAPPSCRECQVCRPPCLSVADDKVLLRPNLSSAVADRPLPPLPVGPLRLRANRECPRYADISPEFL